MASVRSAQERLGFFSEPQYISIGDKYKSNSGTKPFNMTAYKNKQMMTTTTKKKVVGSNDGFLDGTYKRLFTGEAATDMTKVRRKEELKQKKKNISTNTFAPVRHGTRLSGSGSHIGTFTSDVMYLSPKSKAQRKSGPEKRNFTTAPSKKGSGFGYADVTLNKFPEYKSTPFDAALKKERQLAKAARTKKVGGDLKLGGPDGGSVFDKDPFKLTKPLPPKKNKSKPPKKVTVPFYPTKPPPTMASGNAHLGTLNKFTYVPDKKAKSPKKKPPLKGEWKPTHGPKLTVTKSVVSMNVTRGLSRSSFSM